MWDDVVNRMALYTKLGFPQQKMPPDFEATIEDFEFPRHPQLNGIVVKATCIVTKSPVLRESKKRPGVYYRQCQHRIFIVCPYCEERIPFGRWAQHKGSKKCMATAQQKLFAAQHLSSL